MTSRQPLLALALLCGLGARLCMANIGSWVCKDTITDVIVDSGDFGNSIYVTFSTPTDPNSLLGHYRPNTECGYQVTMAPNRWLMMYFTNIDLEFQCGHDWMVVYRPTIPYHICGLASPYTDELMIQSNFVQFTFNSNAAISGTGIQGFIAEIFIDKKRSPQEHLSVLARRSVSATGGLHNSLDLLRRDAKMFHTWIKHLNDLTTELDSNTATVSEQNQDQDQDADDIGALGLAMAETEDNGHKVTNTDADTVVDDDVAGKRESSAGGEGTEESDHATASSVAAVAARAEEYVSRDKLHAMIGLVPAVHVGEYCGREAGRLVGDIVDNCIRSKN